MKKILLSLFILLTMAGYSQQRLIDAKKINVREKLYSNGYDLIYPGDSTGQFDYDNMEDPVLDLDGVNLRTLRRYINSAYDTAYVVDGDTIIIPKPDTFYSDYEKAWKHNGETFLFPDPDSVYIEWMQEWVSNGETVARDVDSIYIDSLDIIICNNCYIVTDTTNFYVKRSSCNYNCWTYSFDGVIWLPWFCLPEIEPETKLYIFAKDSNLLNVYHRLYYNDSDSIGYKNNSRYIDKWLYYGVDSIYWRQSPDSLFKGGIWYNLPDTIPNDSLFMDGIWYNLPDTLPINLDSLIYINNIPISVGDTIFTHDSIYYNGEWVLNDTIHIVDNSITNELDSIQINGTWLNNGDSFNVDTSKWVYDVNGFHSKNNENVGIGGNSDAINEFYVNGNSYFNGNIGIGSYYSSSYKLKIQTSETNKSGVDSYSQYGIGISAESTYERAAVFNGGIGGVLVTATSGTGGSFENHPAILEIERNNNEGYSLQYISCEDFFQVIDSGRIKSNELIFPIYDGLNKQVLATHGDGYLYFDNVENLTSALWNDTYNGISTAQKIGVGTNDANDNAMIYTDIQGDSIGILIEKYGSGDYMQFKDREDNTYFSVDSGGGVHTTSLTVGDSTVTTIRSGATFTIWQGTQAAYDAIGTKDAKTIYYIEQNFNIIQILFFLLMFFGSRGVFGQSNWAAVNIGTTEMKKIYVGDKLVWEKKPDSTLICGKYYRFVTIGTQTWLAENLHCDDGGGGIYSYNDDTAMSDEYGYLYTWEAAMRLDTLIAGWHLPSLAEINTLDIYTSDGGGKLKETGTTHWNSPNTGATDIYNFTALGGGTGTLIGGIPSYSDFKDVGVFYTTTLNPPYDKYYMFLIYNSSSLFVPSLSGNFLVSVRLIKD